MTEKLQRQGRLRRAPGPADVKLVAVVVLSTVQYADLSQVAYLLKRAELQKVMIDLLPWRVDAVCEILDVPGRTCFDRPLYIGQIASMGSAKNSELCIKAAEINLHAPVLALITQRP